MFIKKYKYKTKNNQQFETFINSICQMITLIFYNNFFSLNNKIKIFKTNINLVKISQKLFTFTENEENKKLQKISKKN